jgi:LuxR family maltose regulon positive regulatory protein
MVEEGTAKLIVESQKSVGRHTGAAEASGVRAGPVGPGLAVAKLGRPRVPPAFVVRHRLIRTLDVGSRRPVTLVSAGPGWGKTLLAASWAATGETPGPVGWLSLDQEDNCPTVFWSTVVAALRGTGAVPDGNDLVQIGAGVPADQALTERIIAAVRRLPGPVVLVLDDLQVIDNPEVMRGLGVLLRYQPEQLRLVLVTRVDPALPLRRLRAAGLLTEIRATDLEFGTDEAAELLSQHGLQLSADELRVLLEQTEGWAAGLRLAACYLTAQGAGVRHRVADFAGDKTVVADYLIGEVLDHQPPEVRRFLMYTSIVDQVSGGLADAIMESGHGQAMLERLERANAFVVGLGARPQWFHYHHLLGDLLRHLLQIEEPELMPELHLRAAAWYSENNAQLKAVAHAASAGDWPLVGHLMVAGVAPFVVSSERWALVKLLQLVPPDQFPATVELKICAALLMLHAGNYDAIPGQIADARRLLDGRNGTDRWSVACALSSLEAELARVRGDIPALIGAATDVLRLLIDVGFDKLASALQYRATAVSNKGAGLLWTGELDRADRYLHSAVMAARAAGVELVEISAVGHLALIELMRGSLGEAYDHALAGRDLAVRRGWAHTRHAVPSYLVLAMVELERHHLAGVEQALDQGFDANLRDPEAAQRVALRIAYARLLLVKGRPDEGAAVLERLRQETDMPVLPPVLARSLALAEAEIDLVTGRSPRVREGIAMPSQGDPLARREQVWRARAELALGNAEEAEARLAPVRESATDVVAVVEAWLVTAVLADVQGRSGRSVEAMGRALSLAESQGIRRPFFVFDRPTVAMLVERHRVLTQDGSPFVAGLLTAMQQERSPADSRQMGPRLSSRELEVLRYLPTVLNTAEIAGELHVSVNTAKAHIRSIYRKLDASRRLEAVNRAREAGFLW